MRQKSFLFDFNKQKVLNLVNKKNLSHPVFFLHFLYFINKLFNTYFLLYELSLDGSTYLPLQDMYSYCILYCIVSAFPNERIQNANKTQIILMPNKLSNVHITHHSIINLVYITRFIQTKCNSNLSCEM